MTPDAKRKRDDECIDDRISNLPRHLIDNILDRMLICDAARTSILSKTWKNIWETYPNILLVEQSMNQFISSMNNKEAVKLQYLRVVNLILLGHVGPILTFFLSIPAYSYLGDTPYFCLWIKQLAEKGVKVLDLRNQHPSRSSNMPSYFFSCSDLTSLFLDNWKLNPPNKFRGFRNLTKITLWCVIFKTNMSFGTQVQKFRLLFCSRIEHLDIQLTNHGRNIRYLNIGRDVKMEKRYALDYNPFTDIKKSFNLRRRAGFLAICLALKLLKSMPSASR
ncbi:F-box/FBD/LRR-repeat protein At1g13570-like [Apium graveolens]|uniref:F-box/FBD/LRR-repeat protein At1g13570-like n=1 Tax=Apium graveolens TaxID=4045 RepID=UPI003D7A1C88